MGDASNSTSASIGYVCQQFPALTQTFSFRRIAGLIEAGARVTVFSVKSGDPRFCPDDPELSWPTIRLLKSYKTVGFWAMQLSEAFRSPRRYWGLLIDCSRLEDKFHSRRRLLIEVFRGFVLARELRAHSDISHLHAEFAGSEATIAYIAAKTLGKSFSFTSHSSKYEPFLTRKLNDAKFVIAVSEFERERLIAHLPAGTGPKIHVIRHGIDASVWKPRIQETPTPLVLSVGTLQEKKGHAYLIKALEELSLNGMDLHCDIVGEGPLARELAELVRSSRLDDRVKLVGALPNDQVRDICDRASVFVLACVTSKTEGTDGIPTVLVEAMALGKACVSTPIGGIPELIIHGETGLIVRERDEKALADAIRTLIADPGLRQRLGRKARKMVVDQFDEDISSKKVVQLIREATPRN